MTDRLTAIPFDRLAPEHHALVGGKCASLGTMSQAGLPVPPGFAVTTQVFLDAKHTSGLASQINELIDAVDIGDSASLSRVAERVRELVLGWPLPEVHESRIRRMYA